MNRLCPLVMLSVFGILLAALGCGKKGAPFLPEKAYRGKVTDLRGEWREGEILLKGKVSGPWEGMEGARVYYARYPLDKAPCEGCPIDYRDYQAFGVGAVKKEAFFCRIPAKVQGQAYFLRVNLIGPGGGIGPPSDTVKVVVQ